MFKIGNLVINKSAIAYVDLEAKQTYITDKESTPGVRIHLKTSDNLGNLPAIFFKGEQAEQLRHYFTSLAYDCEYDCGSTEND